MHRRPRQFGMTLIELTLGLASLSVLGLAIGSLMTAAGNAWDTKDHFVEQAQSMRAMTSRVDQWVRQARRIVSTASDSRYADVVIWADDDSDVGNVNLGELKVITYDDVMGTLTLYQADATASAQMDPAVVGSDSFGPSFRSRNDVDAYPLAADVVGFSATVTNGMYAGSMSYRYLHMEVAFRSPAGNNDQVVMIGAAVRAPDLTVDFIGETGDGGGAGSDSSGPSGASVSLGTGVGNLDIDAAVSLNPDNAVASVFVGSTTLGVSLGGVGIDASAPTDDQADTGSSGGRNTSPGNRDNGNRGNGGQDSAADRDRGRGNDNRDTGNRNGNNGNGNGNGNGNNGNGNGNNGNGNGNGNNGNGNGNGNSDTRTPSRDRGNIVTGTGDRGNGGRDSDADHDQGPGNDDRDPGNRSSDRDRGNRR